MTTKSCEFGQIESVPALIPAVGEDIYTSDAHVLEVHLINVSNAAASVTIVDKQSPPVAVTPPSVMIAPNEDAIWHFTGRYAPGGLHWSASADNAIVGYLRWRKQ